MCGVEGKVSPSVKHLLTSDVSALQSIHIFCPLVPRGRRAPPGQTLPTCFASRGIIAQLKMPLNSVVSKQGLAFAGWSRAGTEPGQGEPATEYAGSQQALGSSAEIRHPFTDQHRLLDALYVCLAVRESATGHKNVILDYMYLSFEQIQSF